MRRSSLFLFTAALALAVPAMAKPAWVAKAKAAGIANASCATCHTKAPALNPNGEFAKAHMKDGAPDFVALKKHIG